MKRLFAFVLFGVFAAVGVFAQIDFLSPIEGVWSNKQMLVIDNANQGDYYYSVDGSDPEAFGFAYDGPVLLDVTGEVRVNVTHVLPNGKKESAIIEYAVNPDNADNTDYCDFITTFFDSGIINYSAGSILNIPDNLLFSLGLPPDSYLNGKKLSVNADCVLSRYVPCVIYDSRLEKKYRFIIKIFPQSAGLSSSKDVPFTITDWETITFTDDNLLYKIDSEYWELPKKPKILDRTVSHMISWQPLEYDSSNPIEFFVLPPKPQIITEKNEDGSVTYTVVGDDSYTLSLRSKENGKYQEFFKKLGLDVFVGDRAYGKAEIGVFSNSVYQGKIEETYSIDKRPPITPEIKSTAKAFYSRDAVNLQITAEKNSELYIAVSEPFSIENGDVQYSIDSPILKNLSFSDYKLNKSNVFKVNWTQRGMAPVFYKIRAFSKNGFSSSPVVEYSVIIDQSNFYFDKTADAELAEGTVEHPFTSVEQCAKGLSKNRSVTLKVKGEMFIDKQYTLESNIEIIDDGDASLVFGPEGSFVLKGATLTLNGFNLSNQADKSVVNIVPFFKLEKAVLNLKDCVVSADFSKNGTVIDSSNSIINLENIIASVNAVNYSSFISGVKSRITLNKSSVAVSGETNVIISATDGNVSARNNKFFITGRTGRIAELFGVKASFVENKFNGNFLSSSDAQSPIFKNKTTTLTDKDNEKIGF